MTGVWRGFCFVPTPPRTVFRTFSFHSSYCLHTHVPLDYIYIEAYHSQPHFLGRRERTTPAAGCILRRVWSPGRRRLLDEGENELGW